MLLLGAGFILGQVARIQIGNVGFTPLDLFLGFTVVSWFGYRLIKRKETIIFGPAIKLYLVFILVGTLSLIMYAANLNLNQLGTAFLYTVRLLIYSGLYFPVRSLDQKDRQFVLGMLSIVGGGVVALGYIQYFFYPYLRNLYYLGWDDHLYRMFSVFLDPNFAGAFFVLFLLFLLDRFLNKNAVKSQVLTAILAFGTLLAIYLTYSRTGFIMLLVGLGVYLLSFTSRKIAIGVLIGCLVVFTLLANTKIEGLNPFRTASSEARIESAQHAFQIFQKYPLFGVGFNAYRYAQVQMGFREELPQIQSHADASTDVSVLFVLATTGITGGAVFIAFWLDILKKVKFLATKRYYPARSLLAGLLSLMVGSLFINLLFYPMIIVWVVVQGGLIQRK